MWAFAEISEEVAHVTALVVATECLGDAILQLLHNLCLDARLHHRHLAIQVGERDGLRNHLTLIDRDAVHNLLLQLLGFP